MTIAVLLVDDRRLMREALRDALAKEPDMEVVGEAADASGAFDRTSSLMPNVVVLNIGLRGIDAASRLKEMTGVDTRVVVLSDHAERRFVIEVLHSGADAYVTKSSASAELVRAIRAAAAGENYICPDVANSLVKAFRGRAARGGESSSLTRREREVLRLVAEGARSIAIAGQLNISVGTVEVHRRNIMRKLGLRTVAEATRYAVREGLVAP